MKFRTEIDIPPLDKPLSPFDKGLAVGSCFAENIGGRMRRAKFDIAVNPFGVMFNPYSVADTIERVSLGRGFATDELENNGSVWCSFSLHGSFSSTDPESVVARANTTLQKAAAQLPGSSYVIVTLGTAWIYELADGGGNGSAVANCHKFPASHFRRRRLTVAEITSRLGEVIEKYLCGKTVILTVSPVRHIKDGLAENSLSKATLLLAANELASLYRNVRYFPAYEIMNDDLRDYRFYGQDLVHPSEIAVSYIWEKFCGYAFDGSTKGLIRETEALATAMEHRPQNTATEEFRKFRQTMISKAVALEKKYPGLDLAAEKEYFENE